MGPVMNEADDKKAPERISALPEVAAGTPEGVELETLAALVDAYEHQTSGLEGTEEAQPFRGLPVSYVEPTAPVAVEDWEAGS